VQRSPGDPEVYPTLLIEELLHIWQSPLSILVDWAIEHGGRYHNRPLGEALQTLARVNLLTRAIEEDWANWKTPWAKAPISKKLRRRVFERDGLHCLRCGKYSDLVVDHIVPESLGGPTRLTNLQTLCSQCNAWKRTKLPEWGFFKRQAILPTE
jgi:hypothetical protein